MEKFIVETSARHVHVTKQDLETLFGEGYELHVKKMLSQPGQYASEERVDVVRPQEDADRREHPRPRPQRDAGRDFPDRRAHPSA